MKTFKIKSCLLLFTIFYFSAPVLAKHVLPIFTGFWYTNVNGSNVDACGLTYFSDYVDKTEGDAANIAKRVLQNVPPHEFCTWSVAKLAYYQTGQPTDFMGTVEDWEQICKQQPDQRVQTWERVCVDDKGYVDDRVEKTVMPSYSCPIGSRYSLFDADSGFIGCSNKPSLCFADVVLRDLASNSMARQPKENELTLLGHIGLTFMDTELGSQGKVLEVLDDNQVIQTNSFENFKSRATYYGDKYSLKDNQEITLNQGIDIMNSGLEETTCDEIAYTAGWDWYPCQYDPTRRKKTAIFRCDSFVYNAYLKGADIKIMDYSFPAMPSDIFNKFLYTRFNSESTYNFVDKSLLHNDIKDITKIDYYGKTYLQEQDIQNIFANNNLDIHKADAKTYYFVVIDQSIPRYEKISFLWRLALRYKDNDARFDYIMNCLDYLSPVELTSELINQYQLQDLKNKLVILRVLSNITSDDAMLQYNKEGVWLQDLASVNTIKISDFFSKLLHQERNLVILEKAIFLYAHIFEPKQAKADIDAVFERNDIDSSKLQQNLFANAAFYTHQLSIILSSKGMQIKYLPALLAKVKQQYNWTAAFNKSLFFYFVDADFYPKKIGFDGGKLDDSVRSLLLQYLNQQQPPQFIANHIPNFVYNSQDFIYYQWLATVYAIQAHSILERNQKIAHYIKNVQDLSYKALLLFYATSEIYNQYSITELNRIHNIMDEKLKSLRQFSFNSNVSMKQQIDFEKLFLQYGISRLNKVLKARDQS